MENVENYFSVVYDIQRPPKVSEITDPVEKARIRTWNRLIGGFIDQLSHIGVRINWSVFIIPRKHYEKAKRLVERYTRLFNEINVRNDIYILEYAPSSNEILRNKIRLQLKLKLEELSKKLEEVDSKERRYILKQLELLRELIRSFGEVDLLEKFRGTYKTLEAYSGKSKQIKLEEVFG